ncbi:hypothetical protein [Nocardioides alcanivorans]|uniref:hypothetical protein n=1 Tax=Nocardioides alcanivorans TaxID=2897352 RepID=UPI001F3C244C|nr:hypothetical protein [Nocardioides alcanivorans]
MQSDERGALSRAHLPWVKGLWALVVAIVLSTLTLLVVGLAHPGTMAHALGRSTEQTATVIEIDQVTFCSRSKRDTYTLAWEEDGRRRTGTVGRCGDPWQLGDEVDIWSTSGGPHTSPPIALRLASVVLVLGFGTAVGFLLRGRSRVRRAVAAALHGRWQPLTLETFGQPGTPAFRVSTAASVRNKRRDWSRILHSATGGTELGSPVPGTLFIDAVHKGRPRGLSLHVTADGGRTWRWHG